MVMPFAVRPLVVDDVPAILRIQESAYAPHLLETGDVFAAKVGDAPQYCLGAQGTEGDLVGYVIAFPMSGTASIGLHEPPSRFSDATGPVLYIHDMAVHPSAHGTGVGRALLAGLQAVGRAAGQDFIELVAIESAVSYWAGHDFESTSDDVYEGYGPGARKMRRAL